MYNENNNNEQNNGYTNNGHPQEYYYSTGNQNYQNNTPNRKPKKQHPFAKRQYLLSAWVHCLESQPVQHSAYLLI